MNLAFDLLDAQKTLTSADIIAHYRAAGLGDGTARSQCGQIMVLFDLVEIAKREGNKLSMIADSLVAKRIRDLKSVPTASAA